MLRISQWDKKPDLLRRRQISAEYSRTDARTSWYTSVMRRIARITSTWLVFGLTLALFALQSHTVGSAPSAPPTLGGCPMFPANNVWNTRIDHLPVDTRSNNYINTLGASTGLHPDFGTVWAGAPNGIPYTIALSMQAPVSVAFDLYSWSAGESDPGPYPIPPGAPIEGGPSSDGDRHVLVVQQGSCKLYELYQGYPQPDGSWRAGSGAVYDLNANTLRPAGWTSADAAGLPILPGLVRYDEVASGAIRHAIRFTAATTRNAYIWPARHAASSNTSLNAPPMGQRFRLKAGVPINTYPAQIQVIFNAFKQYGIILADNGSNWYINGAPDPRWDDDMLVTYFGKLKGSDFEAVDESSLMLNPNSAQVPDHWTYLPLARR